MESQSKEEEVSDQGFGAFEGDLSFDAAHDELATIVESISVRNDELTQLKGFSSIDVPSVRANIVVLTNLISSYGGGASIIDSDRFDAWKTAIKSAFEDPERWGFRPWPDKEKDVWQRACEADLESLRQTLLAHW